MTEYMQRGQAAINNRDAAEAVKWFEKAVKKSPRDPQALASLGQSLCWLKQPKKGLEYLYKAGIQLEKKARKSRDTRQLLLLAEQLQFWEDYHFSLILIKQAIKIDNSGIRGHQLLACTYLRLNKTKQALSASQQALKKAPDNIILNLLQASLESRAKLYDAAIIRLTKITTNPAATSEELYRTHKELALLLDKKGAYEQVFKHLYAAADIAPSVPEIKKQDRSFVPNALQEYTAGFNSALLDRWSDEQFTDSPQAPVFLIGFLRSGTTLTQEVLDTHPDVFVSDESDLLVSTREELKRLMGGTNIAEMLKNADKNIIGQLRQYYWKNAINKYGDNITNQLFIDKTTMNTFDLGFINCIFPDAKILFLVRDPRDVCLSCFMQVMTPSAMTVHLTNWKSLAELYHLTLSWWLHFKKITAINYLEFRYEDTISDFEGTYRNIFTFLGLEWTDEANNFHKHASKKFIASPSYTQVTQPLYSSSLARWKRYENEFTSVLDKLQPFISKFNYD